MNAHTPIEIVAAQEGGLQTGAIVLVAVNKLKPSPRNARRTPHGEAAIEALAASIAVKGVLQAPVVEPETDAEGVPTGFYLVTIGEGRRLALVSLAQRKLIGKAEPVRCVVDLSHDPHEINLDENVTRTAMHPADQFEAFRRLAEERGFSAEEIGARFGVSAQLVRQRLRLGAVSPKLMGLYREGELTLDQLMAFAISEDHARQEQVYDLLTWNKAPHTIRRAMTEEKVSAADRRAIFVGAEAYGEAGGTILRDLFTEDGGGWFEDVGLLDKLAWNKLALLAEDTRSAEGWLWAEARLDYPRAEGLARVYPHPAERPEADKVRMDALSEEYDALVSQWDSVEDLPEEVAARFDDIDAELEAFGDGTAYAPDEIARGGLFVVLGVDGVARIERGFIRPEDQVQPDPEPDADPDAEQGPEREADAAEEEDEGLAPLSERLVLDLTAQRTAALRDALAGKPDIALAAVTHALVVGVFYSPHDRAGCLEIKLTSALLDGHADGIGESPAGRSIEERHSRWASRMPQTVAEAWAFVAGLGGMEVLDLLAHCASLSVNALRATWDRKPMVWAQADALAQAVGLDMGGYWTPTVASYLGRVTKARIAEAVGEGVSAEAAARIEGLKKPEMASEAEALLAGTGWLPSLLRAPQPVAEVADPEAAATEEAA
ncbi:ParB/RepB/Spo0J family partition protein [Phenylobacterium sp.]|uniref:ParB/RepB/Spo0J family partition protein n=1 Tax=Phenylobacterium sp. TaxID=1871053 RepID=UPI0035B254C6